MGQVSCNRAGRVASTSLIDSRIAGRERSPQPDEVVVFGSERFNEVLAKITAANRQGVLSLGGEALFEMEGKIIRVQFPEQEREEK